MSSEKESTTIEKKKNEKIGSSSKTKFNIGSFMLNVLKAIIAVSTYIYLGASILIFSKYYRTNNMQGTDPKGMPYVKISESKIGGSIKKLAGDLYNTIFGLTGYKFPYNIVDGSTPNPSTFDNIILWFTESMAFSFAMGRNILDKLFKFIGFGIYKNNNKPTSLIEKFLEAFILILGPAISLFFLHIFPFVYTFPSIMYSMIVNFKKVWIGWPVFIIGLFLFFSWFYMSFIFGSIGFNVILTSLGQLILLWLFIMFGVMLLPNWNTSLKNIIFNRLSLVLCIFFGYLTPNAFSDLGEAGGYLFLGATICSILMFLYNLFKRSNANTKS